MSNFEVDWNGKYPNLCYGKWTIKFRGKELKLPEDIKREHMNTFGTYVKQGLTRPDYEDFYEEYQDGLQFEDWFEKNQEWLIKLFEENNILPTIQNFLELYTKIKKKDWRPVSCGGCK